MAEEPQHISDAPAPNVKVETQERRQPNYIGVFFALALLTLLEVLVTYTPLPRLLVLMPLAVFKAALVVLFYMHLRYDKPVFGALFGMGLLMGVILIVSLALMFGPPLFGMRQ